MHLLLIITIVGCVGTIVFAGFLSFKGLKKKGLSNFNKKVLSNKNIVNKRDRRYKMSGKDDSSSDSTTGVIIGVIIAILVVIASIGSIVITPAGYCNVVLTFGDATNVRDAGLSIKVPIIQGVRKMSVRTQLFQVENATAASKDLQDASTSIAINYRIDSRMARQIYKEIGLNYIEVIAHPAIQEIVKATTARYDAADLILKREIVKEEIARTLTEKLKERGIIVEAVNITNFKFSDQFTAAIEAKVVAAQKVAEAENKLRQVEVEARQAKQRAEGEAAAAIARAEGQAKAAEILSLMIKDNPSYLQYMYIDKLAANVQVIIVPEGMPMTIPFK